GARTAVRGNVGKPFRSGANRVHDRSRDVTVERQATGLRCHGVLHQRSRPLQIKHTFGEAPSALLIVESPSTASTNEHVAAKSLVEEKVTSQLAKIAGR